MQPLVLCHKIPVTLLVQIPNEALDRAEITGVVKVKAIDAGVVALAEDYWTAQKAARLIDVTWDFGDGDKWSTEGFFSEYRALSAEPGMLAEDIGDAERTLAQRPDAIEAVYELPYLAHATMEPMNCTAEVHQVK